MRGPTARSLLTIEWTFPVHDPKPKERRAGDRTLAASERKALPLQKAYAALAGDDPRPLLVLRECFSCSGTDDALLSREEDNERTVLLSQWFRCVKLPPDVLEEEHPFRALFPGEDPAHLFVAHRDGTLRADLEGDQSRRELWKVMEGLLGEEYQRKPDASVKKLFRLLDRYDVLDERQHGLERRIEEAIEKRGPDSSKVKKLRRELERVKREREETVEDWKETSELVLLQRAEDQRESASGSPG